MKKVMTMLTMYAITLAASAQTVDVEVAALESTVTELKGQIQDLSAKLSKFETKYERMVEQTGLQKEKTKVEKDDYCFSVTEVKGYDDGNVYVTVSVYNNGNQRNIFIDGRHCSINTSDQKIYKSSLSYVEFKGSGGACSATINKGDMIEFVIKFSDVKGQPEMLRSINIDVDYSKTIITFNTLDIIWE